MTPPALAKAILGIQGCRGLAKGRDYYVSRIGFRCGSFDRTHLCETSLIRQCTYHRG